jgi:hypothetical protein
MPYPPNYYGPIDRYEEEGREYKALVERNAKVVILLCIAFVCCLFGLGLIR